MKIKIRLKIVFLGALLSLLVAVIATFASYYIYIERSKDDLKNSIANVLDNLNYDITTEEDVSEFLVKFKTRINNIYEADPDEPDFDTYDEKKVYYLNKYSFMYRKQGMFGLSLDDLNLRNGFLSLQNELLDANVFARVKSVYIAYNDLARGRIVYLVDSRHGESNIEYYLPGSFYELSENDNKYDYGDVKVHTINGIDNLYKELYFKNEDNELETDCFPVQLFLNVTNGFNSICLLAHKYAGLPQLVEKGRFAFSRLGTHILETRWTVCINAYINCNLSSLSFSIKIKLNISDNTYKFRFVQTLAKLSPPIDFIKESETCILFFILSLGYHSFITILSIPVANVFS